MRYENFPWPILNSILAKKYLFGKTVSLKNGNSIELFNSQIQVFVILPTHFTILA